MASTPESSTQPEENSLESSQDSKLPSKRVISYQDVENVYDEVLHITGSSRDVSDLSDAFSDMDLDYRVLGDEYLPRDNYGDEDAGSTVDMLNEVASTGNTLVIATHLKQAQLPFYTDLSPEMLEENGNWWDNPLDVDADYLVDRYSNEGSVRIPLDAETQVKKLDDGSWTFIYLGSQDQK